MAEERERGKHQHKNVHGRVTRYCESIIPCLAHPYLISRFNEATSIFISRHGGVRGSARCFIDRKSVFESAQQCIPVHSSLSTR